MIKFVWRTDVHLSDRAPASRTDDWTEAVLDKLRQTVLVANKINANAILDGGDFFHIKSPSQNSHKLIRAVADLHKSSTAPVYCCVGNHDCVYGDYAYLSQQPLGVLFATGVFNRLYDEHEVVFEENGFKVRVVGVPYHGTEYDMDRFDIKKRDEDYLVVVAHVLASEKGGSMFEGEDIVRYQDIAHLDPDLWLFGHWHKDQGVTQIGSKTFVNIGSLTRGSLSQDEALRKPGVALLSFDPDKGVNVRVVRLKVQPAEEVFDIQKRDQMQARTVTIDAFISSIKDTLVTESGKSIEESIDDLDEVPTQVRERALLYWEQSHR